MPSYRKKYAKKTRSRPYASYKKKKMNRSKRSFPKAKAKIASGFQVLNPYRAKVHKFEDTFTTGGTVGPQTNWNTVATVDMSLIDRYATLKAMYRQYRIKFVRLHVSMLNIETTDGNIIPELYIRYNYDPDLLPGALTVNSMIRQQNMVLKRFLQGDGKGADFMYTFKPCVLLAQRTVTGTNYTSSPKFNQWCDFQSLAANEVVHHGLQILYPNIPTGVTFTYKWTVSYECRDII